MAAHTARMIRERVQGGKGAKSTERAPARTPEVDEIEDRLYREHLEAWIDTRVRALGNRTPPQVSKTARGRERVEALLAGVAGQDKDARPARRDAMATLRRTLGLP